MSVLNHLSGEVTARWEGRGAPGVWRWAPGSEATGEGMLTLTDGGGVPLTPLH